MNKIQPLFDFYRSNLSNKLHKLVKPISESLGLDVIIYTRVDEDGSLLQMLDYPELVEQYWQSDSFRVNPYIRHPAQYRSCTHIITENPTPGFRDSLLGLSSYYCSANVLGVIRKEPGSIQKVTFATTNKKLPVNSIFIRERYLLEKFAEHFIATWREELPEMKQFSINIKDILGDLFFEEAESNYFPKAEGKLSLLKNLKLISNNFSTPPKFSQRELDCIDLLMKGRTSAQIAVTLGLSRRTVESYLENLKSKTNTETKPQLMELLLELTYLNLLFSK